MPKTDLLPTAEVAHLLGVDTKTVHRMTQDGRLPAAMKGPGLRGIYLFERSAVARFLAEQSETAEVAS